jgi:hypothetical protein
MERIKVYVAGRHKAGADARLADYRDALVGMEEVIRGKDAELAQHVEEAQRLAGRILELERQCAELLGRRNEREAAYDRLQDKLASQIEATERLKADFERRLGEHERAAGERERAATAAVAHEPKLERAPEPPLAEVSVVDSAATVRAERPRDDDPSWIRRLGAELHSLTEERGAMQTELVLAAERVTALDKVREEAVREGGLLRAELAAPIRPARRERDPHSHAPAFSASAARTEPAPAAPREHAPTVSRSRGEGRRLVTMIDGARVSYPLRDGELTVGRSKHCDISIPSQFVSRIHATLSTRGTATFIVDSDSKNGIFVNSQRVNSHELRDGDVVSLGGQLDLLFVDASA